MAASAINATMPMIVASFAPMSLVNRPVSGVEMDSIVLVFGTTGVELPGSTTLIVILVLMSLMSVFASSYYLSTLHKIYIYKHYICYAYGSILPC